MSSKGIAADLIKTGKIAKWPSSTNIQQIQQSLGLASYYRRFTRNFAAIARPPYRIMEWGRPFAWTEDWGSAFAELKSQLASNPVLRFLPPFYSQYRCQSDRYWGCLITDSGWEGESANQALTKAKIRYSVTRQELLAVVTFICLFHNYLLGKYFGLWANHSSLKWLHSFREPEGQVAHWLKCLQEFNFDVQHCKGKLHSNADSLCSTQKCQKRESNIYTALLLKRICH